MPRILFLYGPAACGKLTIGRALAELTGDALFHNHLTVDLLRAVFPFGSPEFVRHRDQIWLGVMGDALRTGKSLIFTFHPEASVPTDFPARLTVRAKEAGGSVTYIRITCEEEEVRRRLGSANRVGAKLSDLALHDRLKSEGAFDYPDLPADFTVDSTSTPARQNAEAIAAWLRGHP